MKPPEYRIAASLDEALELLASGGWIPVCGGTDIMVKMRKGTLAPAGLLDISQVCEPETIEKREGRLRIGAAVRVETLAESPLLRREAPVLCEAAAELGSPQIRTSASLGGNLANASPVADLVPPLAVLEAEVVLVSAKGTRRVPLEDFFVGPGRTVMHGDELITAVECDAAPADGRVVCGYRRLGQRKALSISKVSAAVRLELRDDIVEKARIALGAVGPTVIRAVEAERRLEGSRLSGDAIEEAARLAEKAASPIDDHRSTASYRKAMCGVLVRRILEGAGNAE